uniref:Uncharacterized protein n=1 Tax=Utricularia reniformis TaxID=192314 RepID=A0A1Y0B4F1_9LAMI|nr:hypothetical protein AEK19_MT2116 [Utricularia reniformis]ART32268.1 hypothetical protein AEK19_MT2116 [Utricularia reniformis]
MECSTLIIHLYFYSLLPRLRSLQITDSQILFFPTERNGSNTHVGDKPLTSSLLPITNNLVCTSNSSVSLSCKQPIGQGKEEGEREKILYYRHRLGQHFQIQGIGTAEDSLVSLCSFSRNHILDAWVGRRGLSMDLE